MLYARLMLSIVLAMLHASVGTAQSESWHLREDAASFSLAEAAAYWSLVKKSEDVLILDLRGRSDVCDFFVICTGQTDVQVKAIAGAVQDGLASIEQRLLHNEGMSEGRWVLLDYVDVVIHIFQDRARQYYQLERLWGDAPRVEVTDAYFSLPDVRTRHEFLRGPQPGGSTTAAACTGGISRTAPSVWISEPFSPRVMITASQRPLISSALAPVFSKAAPPSSSERSTQPSRAPRPG